MINDLKKSVPTALRKEGVRDPNLEIVFARSKEEVSIERTSRPRLLPSR